MVGLFFNLHNSIFHILFWRYVDTQLIYDNGVEISQNPMKMAVSGLDLFRKIGYYF